MNQRFGLAVLLLGAVGACGDPPPPKTPQRSEATVPANSVSDARLRGEQDRTGNGEPPANAQGSKVDPTQPYTTKLGEASEPDPTSKPGSSPAAGGGTKGAVSKSECDRVMEKYLELEIRGNPQLKDVPPEVIEQAKQMARERHGDAPCTATRAQYTCAMVATSTATWQRCMK